MKKDVHHVTFSQGEKYSFHGDNYYLMLGMRIIISEALKELQEIPIRMHLYCVFSVLDNKLFDACGKIITLNRLTNSIIICNERVERIFNNIPCFVGCLFISNIYNIEKAKNAIYDWALVLHTKADIACYPYIPMRLTASEWRVISHYVSGYSLSFIANNDKKSFKTISSQKRSAMAKLNVLNDQELYIKIRSLFFLNHS